MSHNRSNPTSRGAHYTTVRRGGSTASAPRPTLRDDPPEIQPTQIPETHASASTQMSFEDFITQPGREEMERLHPTRNNGAHWFGYSHNGITKSINLMLIGMIKHPYDKFTSMPEEERELWFRQFAQTFTWELQHHAAVRTQFDKLAGTMYSRKMNEWKKKWRRNELPKEFLHKPQIWSGYNDYWKQEETEKISRRHSTNRMSERKGKGIATHNAGATSILSREEQLFQLNGVRPSLPELIEDIHTNKKTKQIQCQVAQELCDTVRTLADEYRQSQPEGEGGSSNEVPLEKWNEFVIEATPKSKGRMYGVPKTYQGSSATSRFSQDAELRAELAERTTEIETLKTDLQNERETNARRYDELVASNEATKAAMEAQKKTMDEFMEKMLSRGF